MTLNTDEWREFVPGYIGTNAGSVHEAASWLNKQLYAEALKSQQGKGNQKLMVLAGGGGSGKGTATGDYFTQSDYPLVLDQVSDNLKKLEDKLNDAKANGFTPEYVFIDRPPLDAAGGIVSRALNLRKKGEIARTVDLAHGMKANIEARQVAVDLLKKRPDIEPRVVDNRGGELKRRLITDRGEAVSYPARCRKHGRTSLPDTVLGKFRKIWSAGFWARGGRTKCSAIIRPPEWVDCSPSVRRSRCHARRVSFQVPAPSVCFPESSDRRRVPSCASVRRS